VYFIDRIHHILCNLLIYVIQYLQNLDKDELIEELVYLIAALQGRQDE